MPRHYQLGGYIEPFRGAAYQHGGYLQPYSGTPFQYGGFVQPYQGAPFQYGGRVVFYRRQSGAGFGDILRNIWRFIMPIAAPAAMHAGSAFLSNFGQNKFESGKSWKDSAVDSIKPALAQGWQTVVDKASEPAPRAQAGGQRKRKHKTKKRVYKASKKRKTSAKRKSSKKKRISKKHRKSHKKSRAKQLKFIKQSGDNF